MIDEHVLDLLPGYALGALDADELRRAAAHLPHCLECRQALLGYQQAAHWLVQAVPEQSPRLELRAQVLRRVQQQAAGRLPAAPQERAFRTNWLDSLRAAFRAPALGRLAAGLALLALVLVWSNILLWQQLQDLQARNLPGEVRVVAMAGTENAPAAAGYVLVFPAEPYGSLTIEHAPALEEGFQYQLWLIENGQRTSGGVFSVNADGYATLQIDADRPLDAFDAFGITVEPEGGSPAPTGLKVLGGDL